MKFYIDHLGEPYSLHESQAHLALAKWQEVAYEEWEVIYRKYKTKSSSTPSASGTQNRAEIIKDRLHQIDHESIRPLRAIILNHASEGDYQKLEDLENERTTLVEELGKFL
ncbi:hypothetical protein QCB45_07310 [Thiomicrorhabdus sp. ZW0627]|uniref:hypothetical protein n=1 Tax=Thiomicrorhabdus sp. ZW0627 TaxID=3039774 RepID=UPI0024368321|nr:hypothetical protein [Thiomicrorhabdus sp. ZW0627]MDG6774135.1 hypothetical protein [Thiomicrorhabdus sp. ZW0627]